MWESRHERVFPGLRKQDVWAAWADVNNWHRWDDEIEFARMNEPFRAGSRFVLKPRGGPEVKITIVEADPSTGFTDVTNFPLARMYDMHEMVETGEGLKLISTIRMEGLLSLLWRKLVAEGVASGAAKQMEALARFAAGSSGD